MEKMPALAEIYLEASTAASKAADELIAANPNTWYPCGFAWVRIKPARGKFVSWLKEQKIGRTDDYLGGYIIHNPSGNSTQWMYAKEEGASAFVEVLRKYGINAKCETRID